MLDRTSSCSRVHLVQLGQQALEQKFLVKSRCSGWRRRTTKMSPSAIAVDKLRATPHLTLIGATSAFAMDNELLKQDIRDFLGHTSVTIRQSIFPSSAV